MNAVQSLCLIALLLPSSSKAQVDIQIGQSQSQNQSKDGGSSGGLIAGGLSLGLAALSARQKFEARDAALPEASATDVLFVLEDGAQSPAAIATAAGLTLVEAVRLDSIGLTMAVAALPKGDTVAAAIARLGGQSGVLWAQPNHVYQLLGESTSLPRRFALHRIPAAPPAAGTIALIDSSVAVSHEALRGASIREERFVASTTAGVHGTAIASLLVGTGQVPGIARGAQLVSFAAFEEQKKGPALSQTRLLAKALGAAIRLKPGVINLSFGGAEDRLLARLLDSAQARAICVVAAAGNGGKTGSVPFPASHLSSLAVTAVDEKLRPYAYATPGERIDVAGVGVNLLAAAPKGYRAMSGTSFATAIVAGGLLRSCTGALPATGLRGAAAATAQDLGAPGKDSIFGAGLFQAGQ
jgi:hypothetical protein